MRHPERIRLKDGVVYQLRFPNPAGGMQHKRFRSKRAATKFSVELETARAGGVPVVANARWDDVLKEFRADHYIPLRPSAIVDYDTAFARLRPYVSGKQMRAITSKAISEFRDTELKAIRARQRAIVAQALVRAERRRAEAVAKKADPTAHDRKLTELRARLERVEQAGARAVNKSLGALSTLLKFAESRGYVGQNAARHVRKLKVTAPDRPMDQAVLAPAELAALVAAAGEVKWRGALGVLGYGGLRLGETLGLQWGDVELDRGRILVRGQLCARSGVFREPKTPAGRRFVELPGFVIRDLRAWKLACPPPPEGEKDWCFPNGEGGPEDQHNFRSRVFGPALRRAGLRRVRVHDLRHGCASMLIAAGADIAAVSRQLGHANVGITLGTYSHWFAKRNDTGLGARLEAFLAAEQDGCVLVANAAAKNGSR